MRAQGVAAVGSTRKTTTGSSSRRSTTSSTRRFSASPTPTRDELIREALEQFLSRNDARGRPGGDLRARAERPGAVHQVAAGRSEEDSRHRQVRSPAADSLRARRRGLGLPADGRRQRRRRLRARDRSRPVRDEARPGRPALEAVRRRRHRGRHHPARAAGDLQLRLLRPARQSASEATTRTIRRRRRWCSRSAPTRPTW